MLTRTLTENSETAQHEMNIANTWCNDAIKRVRVNVNDIFDESSNSDSHYDKIATEVLDNQGYKAKHILDI